MNNCNKPPVNMRRALRMNTGGEMPMNTTPMSSQDSAALGNMSNTMVSMQSAPTASAASAAPTSTPKVGAADYSLPGNSFSPMAVPQLRDGGEVSPWSLKGMANTVSKAMTKSPEAQALAEYKARAEQARQPAQQPARETAAPMGSQSVLNRREAAAGLRDGGDLGGVGQFGRNVGEYWSEDNAKFEAGNPGLVARVGRSFNPVTGFGSAVGAMHDGASKGSLTDMGVAAAQATPLLAATKTIKHLTGLSNAVHAGKTAARATGQAATAGLRDGGDLKTGHGGPVPGKGSGDKIPALYEPGEFVVSNDMLNAQPELREQLHSLRGNVLASQGKSVQQADAEAVSGKTLRANAGFIDDQAKQDATTAQSAFTKLKDVNQRAGAAIADVATLVPRGIAGAYDSAVVRPMRAAGINAAFTSPLFSPAGADPASQTPFYDKLRSADAAQSNPPATLPASAQAESPNQTSQTAGRTSLRLDGRTQMPMQQDPRLLNADTSRPELGRSRDFSNELNGARNPLPADLREGVVHKTVDAQGRVTYSGRNVSQRADGSTQMVDGMGRDLKMRGNLDVVAPGSIGLTQNGFAGTSVAANPEARAAQLAAGQAKINASLRNPDGTNWSANDSAVMAANLRDGMDPYMGTSRQAKVDDAPKRGEFGYKNYMANKQKDADRAVTLRGQDLEAERAKGTGEAAKRAQINDDRKYELDVARLGIETANKNRDDKRAGEEAFGKRIASMVGKDEDGSAAARVVQGANLFLGDAIREAEAELKKNPGNTVAARDLQRLQKGGVGSLDDKMISQLVLGQQGNAVAKDYAGWMPWKGKAKDTAAPVQSLKLREGMLFDEYVTDDGSGNQVIPKRALKDNPDLARLVVNK